MKILTSEEAITIGRPDDGPWRWPEVVQVAADGDPLAFAHALRSIKALYDNGYALVKLFGEGSER